MPSHSSIASPRNRSRTESFKDSAGHFIGSIKQTLHYQVDNQFILHGYRINYNSPLLILKSLFHRHNELLNIWTHLIGSILVVGMVVYVATEISYIDTIRQKVSSDLEQIFEVFTDNSSNRMPFADSSNVTQVFDQLDSLEKGPLTPSNYQELMNSLSSVHHLLSVADGSLEQFEAKLHSIKRKIIEQIDSETFDWMEIYRYDYSKVGLNLKFSNVRLRKSTDPLHVSRWPIFVFLSSAIMCLMGSTLFHLFYQMSEKANRYLMRVDYAGISLLILGSSFPPFYYGFYCDIGLRYFYLFVVGSACTAVYVISIFDFIHSTEWRKVKGIMYGSLGLLAGVPAMHLYMREFFREEVSDYLPFTDSFIYYVLMGSSYLIGLCFYVFHIPERFMPGKFDILGHSHQIWHCFVFAGVLFSYIGALDNLDDRRFTACLL